MALCKISKLWYRQLLLINVEVAFFINVWGENGPIGKLGAPSDELTYEKISEVSFFFVYIWIYYKCQI
jgi:hypothetical protein